jgi:hypothetical protein
MPNATVSGRDADAVLERGGSPGLTEQVVYRDLEFERRPAETEQSPNSSQTTALVERNVGNVVLVTLFWIDAQKQLNARDQT